MRATRIITVPLAALLTAAAVAGPATAGRRTSGPHRRRRSTSFSPSTRRRASSGFDWGSAGIGAAGGVGALAVALPGSTGMRR